MIRNPKPAATEILERIGRLKPMLARDASHFPRGSDRRDVLERCLEVVSEASRSMPDDAKAAHPEVPWRALADLGNVLRHGYDNISTQQLLDVMADHLEPLEAAVRAILADLEAE